MVRPILRHIILDLDGTLVDSHAQITAIVDAMRAERGAGPVDPVASRRHMSLGGEYLVATLMGAHRGDPVADLADFRGRYANTPTQVSALYPGVAEGLTALHAAGLTLALCSNKVQHLCEAVLRDTGIADLFTVVVGGRAELRAKPAPDMLAAVLEVLAARAAECVYVGDSEVDHATAQSLGVPFRFVGYGYAAPDWRYDGERFERFADLVAALTAPDHA